MNNKNFKNKMDRLQQIVNTLEKNELELEDTLTLFEEGLTLIKDCEDSLTVFDDQIKALIERFEEK